MSSAPGGSTAETRSAVGFLIELARALHSFGSPAHRLEAALALMAEKLGLAGQFFSTPTAIFAYLGQGDQQQTVLVRVEPGSVDLARLSTLEEVIGEVAEKRLSAAQAAERVRQALAEPDRWGPSITTLAFGLASAAAACFFGGGWAEIASAGGVLGEITVVVAGAQPRADVEMLVTQVQALTDEGMGVKDACARVIAANPGAPSRRELYDAVLRSRQG